MTNVLFSGFGSMTSCVKVSLSLSLPTLEAWTLLNHRVQLENRNNHFVRVEVRWTCPRDHVWEKFLRKVKKTINIRSNHVFNQSSCFCDHFRHKNAYDVKYEATVRRERVLFYLQNTIPLFSLFEKKLWERRVCIIRFQVEPGILKFIGFIVIGSLHGTAAARREVRKCDLVRNSKVENPVPVLSCPHVL